MIKTTTNPRLLIPLAIIAAMCILALWAGMQVGQENFRGVFTMIALVIGIVAVIAILDQPHWGLALIVATLPVVDLLPNLPMVSSVFPVLGAATVGSYILLKRRRGIPLFPEKWSPTLLIGLVFLAWLFISNPEAAVLSGRGVPAIVTYIQLWILMYLAVELVNTPERHRHIMVLFILAVLFSAVDSLTLANEASFNRATRLSGLTGTNTSARLFTIAILLLTYLTFLSRIKRPRWLTLAGAVSIGVLFLALTLTVSRTGIMLIILGMSLLFAVRLKQLRIQHYVVIAIGLIILLSIIPDTYWQIFDNISDTVENASDTRALLWEAGVRMWQDHPIVGVGIGQYRFNLSDYNVGALPRGIDLGAHNTYVALLSETGAVGLFLFCAMFLASFWTVFRTLPKLDQESKNIAYVWAISLFILLIGGITKHDHYDKFLWFSIAITAAIPNLIPRNQQAAQAKL